ncbi:MAG: Serine acetyltransferase, plasmid [Nitrospira sp.]|nr:MAG: Serine acetyltransferase, plasmid [Nitrospira sp.]
MERDSVKPSDAASATWNIDQVVAALRHSREVEHNVRHQGRIRELPSRKALLEVLDGLCAILFPTHYGRPDLNESNIDYFVGNQLHQTLSVLQDQVRRGLLFVSEGDEREDTEANHSAYDITTRFAAQLPAIRAQFFTDLQAAYQGDPAATSSSEILLCYPGMTAVIYYRVAHALYELGARLPARLISDIAHSTTGIDIHPAANIGGYFFIDHGTGVVVGETCRIGRGVKLYHGVTLGARSFAKDEAGHIVKGGKRHPDVGDHVTIYPNSTILGGETTIGENSTIGANVFLMHSIAPNSLVIYEEKSLTILNKTAKRNHGNQEWSI